MKTRIPLNIPNILSLYRLFSFPAVLYLVLAGYEKPFAWMLCINLVTDILDGLIARTFHMETEIGAKIDSMADTGTYILAFLGIILFKWPDFQPHAFSFLLFVGLFAGSHLLSVVRFGRLPSLHLYSSKIGGYLQGTFFFVVFAFQFNVIFYYVMVLWGIGSFTEHIIIQCIIPRMIVNAKGLYWVLQRKRQGDDFRS